MAMRKVPPVLIGALCVALVLLLSVVSLWALVPGAVVLASAYVFWRMLRAPEP